MFANRKYEELSYPQKSENVRPHTSNCIKMRPHYSQSSREIDYEQSLFFFMVRRAKRPRFSRLAASPLNARARGLPLLNLKKKRDCSQSSRENATPSNGTSQLASYKEVPPPPGGKVLKN